MSEYCERCNNILSITRSIDKKKKRDETETPNTVSNTADDNEDLIIDEKFYEEILKKIEKDDYVSDEDIKKINIDELIKSSYYKKVNKKGEIKKKIINSKQDLDNADANTDAYLICYNCSHHKKIPDKFLVLTKNQEGESDTYDYIDMDTYRNNIYLKTLPRTRNFKCDNKKCKSNDKDGPTPEACFFRKH